MRQLKISIFISVALSGLAFAVIMPILAPLVRELGLSESQGGAIVSIGSITMAMTAAFWGAKSDVIGRKPIILYGFSGLFVSYILYTTAIWLGLNLVFGATTIFILLIVSRAIIGAFLPAIVSAAQALMADNTSKEERSSGMALVSSAQGVGMIVGPAIGGALALFGIIWPFVIATILFLFGLVYAWKSLPSTPPKVHEKPEKANPFDPAIWPWLLAGFIIFSAILTLQVAAGFYFQDRLNLTTDQTGPILAVALTLVGVLLLITQLLQMKVLKWAPRKMLLVGAPVWIIASFILLLTDFLGAYYFAYALFGISAGFLMPAFTSGASLGVSSKQQGAVAGLTAVVQGLAAIIAPIGSTLLYEVNLQLPFWIVAAMILGLFLLFLFLKPYDVRQQVSSRV